MTAPDWTELVAGTADLVQLFHGPVPLAEFDLLGLLVDERADSGITVGFATTEVPGAAASPLFEGGVNALEFFLVFSHVEELDIHGWDHTGLHTYDIRQAGSGPLSVRLTGDHSTVAFTAGSCRIEGIRTYRAAVDGM
ncbi:hypothetical protein P3T37_000901 [Kitasatospora sp. MAA4]|uniref:hypothetical protein n=1 Tax=Kitasatospora sp. MAA4 TaxID=3035093 RepID=UPI002474324A|nr:hypothetical protein [Kitasatospora sp. MAA4]MDH6131532.1 hypothetical protein [Kitasatospora sp. MAA4]